MIYIVGRQDGYNPATMWILASITAKFAFAGGAAIASFFLIRHSRRRFGQSENRWTSSPDCSKKSLGMPASIEKSLHGEVNAKAVAENLAGTIPVHDAVRDLLGELDTKMAAYQALLRLGNEVTARLESAIERAQELETKNRG